MLTVHVRNCAEKQLATLPWCCFSLVFTWRRSPASTLTAGGFPLEIHAVIELLRNDVLGFRIISYIDLTCRSQTNISKISRLDLLLITAKIAALWTSYQVASIYTAIYARNVYPHIPPFFFHQWRGSIPSDTVKSHFLILGLPFGLLDRHTFSLSVATDATNYYLPGSLLALVRRCRWGSPSQSVCNLCLSRGKVRSPFCIRVVSSLGYLPCILGPINH